MQDKPYYLEHLVDCANRMIYYRDVSTYLAHNRANAIDKANNKLLKGNIGCLIFTSGDKSFGAEWVAASFNYKNYLKEVLDSGEQFLLLEPEKKNIRCYINSLEKSFTFQTIFPASQDDRTHDSEYLLLNFLGYLIEQKRVPACGRLSLITERIPCESCTAIIREFMARYNQITLDIFYMYDTQDRQPKAFFDSIALHDIRLIKIAFHTVVDFVEIEKNPRIIVGSMVREQGKMFGGAPNQIIQAIDSDPYQA